MEQAPCQEFDKGPKKTDISGNTAPLSVASPMKIKLSHNQLGEKY